MQINIDATRIAVNRPGFGPNILVNILSHLKTTTFNPDINSTYNNVKGGAEHVSKMIGMQQPVPLTQHYYAANYAPVIARNLRAIQKRAIAEDRAINEIFMNGLLTDREISEVRAMMLQMQLSGKKPNDIINLALKDRMIGAFAIVDETNYKLFGLPDSGREALLKNLWRVNTERSFAKTAASTPTIDDLLGREVRNNEAETLAKQEESVLDNRRNELDTVVRWTHDAINHVAVMSNSHPETIYKMMEKDGGAPAPVITPENVETRIVPLNET